MGYPTVPRLGCVFSLKEAPGNAVEELKEACDRALAVSKGLTGWAGIAHAAVTDNTTGDMLGGRPMGPPIDAVIEITARDCDRSFLVAAAGVIGQAMANIVKVEECIFVLGDALCARSSALAPHSFVFTGNRDRRTDKEKFVHWWVVHHSRFNIGSPTSASFSDVMLSYELVARDDDLVDAVAKESGIKGTADMFETILMADLDRFLSEAMTSNHGMAAMYDEEGYVSHEWRIGTAEEAVEARRNGRDLAQLGFVDLIL